MDGTDGGGVAAHKRRKELLIKVHWLASHLPKIVWLQELRVAGCIYIPDAVLLPDGGNTLSIEAQPRRIDNNRLAGRQRQLVGLVFDGLRITGGQQQALIDRGQGAVRSKLKGDLIGIWEANEALGGFIEGIVAQHMRKFTQALGHLLDGGDVMPLEKFLDGDALNGGLGGKSIAAKEQREERGGGVFAIVGGPYHLRQGVAAVLMVEGGPGGVEFGAVQTQQIKNPAGGAIAAGKAAPAVLMGVNEQADIMIGGFFDHRVEIIQVGFIIEAGAGMFDGLPGDQEAQEGEPPGAQAAEMLIGFSQGEGTPDKTDVNSILKARRVPGGASGNAGHLGTTAQIDAAQQRHAARRVDEVVIANLEHGNLSQF